ncbi:unnamed protein product, partial [Penicillium discolor]
EAVAAGAAARRVRVVDGEALLRDGVLEVDRGAVEVGNAHVVDDDLDTVEVDGLVAFEVALVEVELVDQARAAAGLNGDAQTEVVAALLLEKVLHLRGGGVRQLDAVCAGGLCGQGGVAHVAPRDGAGYVLFDDSTAGAEQGLGRHGVPEGVQVQRLVGAVRPGVRILHARHEDLRLRELAHEVGDERDRPADAQVHRSDAVPVAHRVAGEGDRPPARVHEERVAEVDVREGQLGPERGVGAEVPLESLIGLLAGLPGGDTGADDHGHLREQRVRRRRDARRIDADHGDGGLVPDATEDRAVTDGRRSREEPGLVAQRLLGVLRCLGVPSGHAVDRDGAVLVPQRGEETHGRHHRVGHRATEHPGVRRVVERAHLQGEAGVATEGDGQARRDRIPVARVRDDDRIGAEGVLVVGEELREGPRTVLLLPLDEHRDPEVEVVAEHVGDRADRADVGHDAGLVVRGAASVQAAVAHRRLERRRLPQGVGGRDAGGDCFEDGGVGLAGKCR